MYQTPIFRQYQHGFVPNLGTFYHVPIIGAMEKSTHTTEYAALRAELRAARKIADFSQRDLATRLRFHIAGWPKLNLVNGGLI